MRTRLIAALIALAMSMALIGCMSKVKYPAYYTLHLPPVADPPIAGGNRASLAVREFRSPAFRPPRGHRVPRVAGKGRVLRFSSLGC